MFTTIFTFVLIAGSCVLAEIPSYIHVCNFKNPKIEQCILENIDNIKDKICEGIPELDVEPNNPFILDELIISDNPNSKIFLKDVTLSGICDFNITFLHADVDKLHYNTDIVFKHIRLNATYDFNIRILIPFKQEAPVTITSDNMVAKVNVDIKNVTNNGKIYVYVSKLKINLHIKDFNIEYGVDTSELNRLNQIINRFIGNNQKDVISVFKPAMEEAIVKRVLFLSNNIVKHFTFEELFPYQT